MNTLMAPFLLSGFIPSVFQWFPIVQRKDEERWGEAWGETAEPYRTKRLVLETLESLRSLTK